MELLKKAIKDVASGVSVTQKTIGGRFHPRCWNGKDAVDWMLIHLKIKERPTAVHILSSLQKSGFFILAGPETYVPKPTDHIPPFEDSEDTHYVFASVQDRKKEESI